MTEPSPDNASIPEIALSKGDLALVLAGYKTLHYIAASPVLQDQTVMLVDRDDAQLRFPVRITASDHVANKNIKNAERSAAGRYIPARLNEHGFYPSYCLPEAEAEASHYQRITMRLLSPNDFKPGSDATLQAMRDHLKWYEQAARTLEPHVRSAHRYTFRMGNEIRKQDRDKELPAREPTRDEYRVLYGVDSSLTDAMQYLRSDQKKAALEPLQQRLYAPSEALRGALKKSFTRTQRHSATPERSYETHARFMEMAAHTRLVVPPGNAALIGMRAVRYVARIDNSNMEPYLGFHDEDTQGIVLLEANESRKSSHTDRSFLLPVAIDLAEPINVFASELSDAIAHQAGYLSAEAMRKSMNIKDGQNPRIHMFRARPLGPQDIEHHELDKAQSIYHDWMNAVGDAWRESGDKTIRQARRFVDALPPEAQRRCLHHIASPEELVSGPQAIPNRRQTGPIPALLQRGWRVPVEKPIAKAPRQPKKITPPTPGETMRVNGPQEGYESVEFTSPVLDPDLILSIDDNMDDALLGVPVSTKKRNWRDRVHDHQAQPFHQGEATAAIDRAFSAYTPEQLAALSPEEQLAIAENAVASYNKDLLGSMTRAELQAYSREWAFHGAAPMPRSSNLRRNAEGDLVRGAHEGERVTRANTPKHARRDWRAAWSAQQVDPKNPTEDDDPQPEQFSQTFMRGRQR